MNAVTHYCLENGRFTGNIFLFLSFSYVLLNGKWNQIQFKKKKKKPITRLLGGYSQDKQQMTTVRAAC